MMYDEDIEKAWTRNEKFKLELASGYKVKEGNWDETHNTYAEELPALAEANKVLDDSALDRFEKIMASQPRAIKQIGGPPGEGIWIIKRKYDNYYNKFGERNSVDNRVLDMMENDTNYSEEHI
eukprot:3278725-Heterocapsa_arctica.AAC.1